MMHSYGCPKESWQLCLGCGAKVCGCHGVGRGQCPECYRGLLTNYYRIGRTCAYKGCGKPAVAAVPRVKFACAEHARSKGGYAPKVTDGDGNGRPTYHTQSVLRHFAEVLRNASGAAVGTTMTRSGQDDALVPDVTPLATAQYVEQKILAENAV